MSQIVEHPQLFIRSDLERNYLVTVNDDDVTLEIHQVNTQITTTELMIFLN